MEDDIFDRGEGDIVTVRANEPRQEQQVIQSFPPLFDQAKDLVLTINAWRKAGLPISEEREARWIICQQCEQFIDGRCKACGCYMRTKTYIETIKCKLGKW